MPIVKIIHQIDLGGAVTGGIDSVIRGIVKWAPDDIEVQVVGLTTDPVKRPVGRWSPVVVDGRKILFLPVGCTGSPMIRRGIPLSLKVTIGAFLYRREILRNCDVLEFHRLEPALPFRVGRYGQNTVVHQNMDELKNTSSDIGWRKFPWLYFLLERRFLKSMDSVFCVRSDACEAYQKKFPTMAGKFRFLPTWVDNEVFFRRVESARTDARDLLRKQFGLDGQATVLIAVGRLDRQKNPLLLLRAFAQAAGICADIALVLVGEGVLRAEVERFISSARLQSRVALAGLRPPAEVATLLSGSDLYVMSSAYEGMPISVLEAMACGLPVVSTRVGEVERVVRNGESGLLVDEHSPEALALAITTVLDLPYEPMSRAAVAAVANFIPQKVLQSVYEAYRNAAARSRPI